MMRALSVALLGALLHSAPLPAQEKQAVSRLSFRVIAAGPGGTATIDRGRRDGVLVGDTGEVLPRGGRPYRFVVRRIADRTSVIELDDKSFVPEPGMRGEVIQPIRTPEPPDPRPRTQTPPQDPPMQDPPRQAEPPGQEPSREPVRWRNLDEEWQDGMPLLTKVPPQRPEERAPIFLGRLFTSGTITRESDNTYDQSFLRVGADLTYTNVGGSGGELRFYGELDYLTEQTRETDADLLLQRFSYSIGGTRWQPHRFEVGRFLQHGMPEFGFLDGAEWSYRRDQGDVIGISAGFLPEPDEDFDTGQDSAVSAYYLWQPERDDVLEYGIGYQKSFHNGDADRDLFVVKMRRIPVDGWSFNSTLWIDYYTSGDQVKDSGLDITQAYVTFGRVWEDAGLDLVYRHIEFPDIERNGEFLPILDFDLARNRNDSAGVRGYRWASDTTRWEGSVNVWNDEEKTGFNGDIGFDVQDDNGWLGFSFFGLTDEFSTGGGARLRYGATTPLGRWDMFYEAGLFNWRSFPSDADDLWQHRVRISRSFYTENGWDGTFYGEAQIFDEEIGAVFGFNVQRRF